MREWYEVSHLIPGEVPDEVLPFEVQILGEHGEAEAVGYFDDTCESLNVAGKPVPQPVIRAAKRHPVGFGDYVDGAGNRLDMWGKPLLVQLETDREKLANLLVEAAVQLITMPSPDVQGGVLRLQAVVVSYGDTAAADQARSLLRTLDAKT